MEEKKLKFGKLSFSKDKASLKIETRIEVKMGAGNDTKLAPKFTTNEASKLDVNLESKIESKSFSEKLGLFKRSGETNLSSPNISSNQDSAKANSINKWISNIKKAGTSPKADEVPKSLYRKILNMLIEKFPRTFSATHPKPLKIGIHKDLASALDIGRRKIKGFLRIYCAKRKYIIAHKPKSSRYDLQGNICGLVSLQESMELHAKLQASNKQKKK